VQVIPDWDAMACDADWTRAGTGHRPPVVPPSDPVYGWSWICAIPDPDQVIPNVPFVVA
jgi:hypothetical protein